MLKFRRILLHFAFLLLGMLMGLLILPLILAGDIYEYQDTVDGVHLPDVDVIVCLAGGRGRIAAAGDLWYRYWEAGIRKVPPQKPPLLFISGMGPQSTWSGFTRQIRSGVRQVIQPDDVFMETESQNTEANALWFSRHLEKNGWKRVLLVTSAYHMKRAMFIFDRTLRSRGMKVQLDSLSAFLEPFGEGEWRGSIHGVHVTVNEYLKWVYYRYFWRT